MIAAATATRRRLVVVDADIGTLKCPMCGVEATTWRERYAMFYHYQRPEPQGGVAYDQVYRCKGCCFIFGHPHPASIEAAPVVE